MSEKSATDNLTALADAFIAAYNAKDFVRCRGMLAIEFYFCHYNRNFEFHDPDAFIETLTQFATDLIPDRSFGPPLRVIESGNTVVLTHRWGGTARADIPGMAAKGARLELDLCTLFVFDGGLISEYHDYG